MIFFIDNFVVFEEYVLPNGINEHIAAAPFQALGSAGIVASLDIKYYEEFSS
jgi:type IV secretory pathway VirB10-like protein